MGQKKRISEVYAQIEQRVPDFMSLRADELVDWLIERYEWLKVTHGVTHQSLADESHLPKGTIDRLLAGKYRDFRYSTIQPLIAVMLRQDSEEPIIVEDVENKEEDAQLLIEGYRRTLNEKNDQIPLLLQHIQHMEETYEKNASEARADWQKKVDYLKQQISRKDKIITILAFSLAAVLLAVIAVLIYDKANPEVGWFRAAADFLAGYISI